ncbi:MAG: DUF72 domain-containing protein [Thermoplasmata archaeon]
MAPELRTGCCSWTSDSWWRTVYPERLNDGDRLAWYAQLWDSVEVDATYYRSPGEYLVRRWASVTPENFLFALKFPRDLIDPRRPLDPEKIAAFTSTVRLLGPKLGPILIQFPPWGTPERVAPFLDGLLAVLDPGLRYTIEFRHRSWFQGERFERLKHTFSDRGIALTWSVLTYVEVPPEVTSDFVYLRFIGDHETVPAGTHGEVRIDRSEEIGAWARRLQESLHDRSLGGFVFFNNHYTGFAPESLNSFRREIGLRPVDFSGRLRDPVDPRTRRLD